MAKYRNSLFICIFLGLFFTGLAGFDIYSSYLREKETVQRQVINTSFLISEWARGEFKSYDYVLQDIVSRVPLSELTYPNPSPTRQKEITALLKSKLETLPQSVYGIGLVNKNCISTHTYNTPPKPSIIGFDGSSREWCQNPKNNPEVQSFVTHAYLANSNQMTVNQIRLFNRNPSGEFNGLAGSSIELSFFDTWLEQAKIGPHGVIAIVDTNFNLLARKPALLETLGKKVDDKDLEEFIASGKQFKSVHSRSPIDGVDRLYGIHKVGDLPFIVVTGEADVDWQASWRQRTTGMVITLVLLWSVSLLALFNYNLRLRERDNLKNALEQIKTLKGIIPICMHCKEIRDDKGAWNKLEKYIVEHSDAEFSHGICEKCIAEKYGKHMK